MQAQKRSSIVTSALLTTVATSLVGGALLIYSGILPLSGANAAGTINGQVMEEAPIVVTLQPVLLPATQEAAPAGEMAQALTLPSQIADASSGPDIASARDTAVIAEYQTQLAESYQALEEAYRQIDTLQTAQEQSLTVGHYDENKDDHDKKENDDD